uniref:Putative ribonuclease H-like domain-containing protein n=1 Tax=Tanacetum cinerariifolium TaxID=118510 RepID=A0A699J4B6_TANCI|nr:putative ribonuclease H-like domain-containing protein [Tanacetum cinerariifolium]
MERRNQTLVEAAITMLIFSRAPLFLWAEAIATSCYTRNRSIIHRQFDKHHTSLLMVENRTSAFFMYLGLCVIPRMIVMILGSLVQKVILDFSLEIINMTFDELSAIAFEQSNLKPRLQSMTSGKISSGLDLPYAPCSKNYSGQVLQTPSVTTKIADTALTTTNSSSQATNIPNTSQDVDELEMQQRNAQQHENQASLQPKTVADNAQNAMLDENTFVNPFATPSTSAA